MSNEKSSNVCDDVKASYVQVQSFVLGVDPYPGWFAVKSDAGLITYLYDDAGALRAIKFTDMMEIERTAYIGDRIIYRYGDMIVVPSSWTK